MSEGRHRFRILIAGGGIAALEAVLALRELLGDGPRIALVTPDDEFVMRPLAVGQPFGLAEAPRLPYVEVAADLDLDFHRDALESIDAERRVAKTARGEEIPFDAALIAIGAVVTEALPGAVTYGGGADNAAVEAMLADLESGAAKSAAFVVPAGAAWPLPIYELAMLTGRHMQDRGVEAELYLITHETRPLEMFGPTASDSVAEALREAGVEPVAEARAAAAGPVGVRLADGRIWVVDRVVAGPTLSALPVPGLPIGPDGFIETDLTMAVKGAPGIYAAGDATWFPVKQGGIAAQQADVAASAIASLADASVQPETFRPMLRGVLFTADAPRFLRADPSRRVGTSESAKDPLWWPPGKVAGRHVAAYIAGRSGESGELTDLGLEGDDTPRDTDEGFGDTLELALSAAELDARDGDYEGALRWLDVAESVNLSLPAEFAEKRRLWAERNAAVG